ncbi:MAG: patatin-like phospholipase family protein, partial [Gemmataceae bacterium]|nr:patatin-like phospholipase family protein [Gemmataceae bacterium]
MVDSRARARCLLGGTALVGLLVALVGCRGPGAPRPAHRALACEDGPAVVPPGAVVVTPHDLGAGVRKPQHVLALSGGGLFGAYSAGVLDGWSRTGTRPEFDVVTGTSAGALIAPFAFLGSEYDTHAMRLYTGVRARDIFRVRSLVALPFSDAFATTEPLRGLIEQNVTPDLMARIADQHRAGRRLYVGTTDLRTRRAVVWDMGAIAGRPAPEGVNLFRDVLLASAAVPGVFPPVPFRITVDGREETEYHVDGGITAQ